MKEFFKSTNGHDIFLPPEEERKLQRNVRRNKYLNSQWTLYYGGEKEFAENKYLNLPRRNSFKAPMDNGHSNTISMFLPTKEERKLQRNVKSSEK